MVNCIIGEHAKAIEDRILDFQNRPDDAKWGACKEISLEVS